MTSLEWFLVTEEEHRAAVMAGVMGHFIVVTQEEKERMSNQRLSIPAGVDVEAIAKDTARKLAKLLEGLL